MHTFASEIVQRWGAKDESVAQLLVQCTPAHCSRRLRFTSNKGAAFQTDCHDSENFLPVLRRLITLQYKKHFHDESIKCNPADSSSPQVPKGSSVAAVVASSHGSCIETQVNHLTMDLLWIHHNLQLHSMRVITEGDAACSHAVGTNKNWLRFCELCSDRWAERSGGIGSRHKESSRSPRSSFELISETCVRLCGCVNRFWTCAQDSNTVTQFYGTN